MRAASQNSSLSENLDKLYNTLFYNIVGTETGTKTIGASHKTGLFFWQI